MNGYTTEKTWKKGYDASFRNKNKLGHLVKQNYTLLHFIPVKLIFASKRNSLTFTDNSKKPENAWRDSNS